MSELRQTANGKWNIVDICHDQAGITIPAKFTYNGVTKSFNITTQKKTIATEWETPVGQAISLDDITRVYTEVKVGNKIYRVTSQNFEIVPAEGGDEPVQVPTITSFVVNPISLPAEGGDINYTVTTNPSNATVRVKCTSFNTTKSTKTDKFSVPANTDGPDPKTFTLSAWCVDNASAIHTKNVTQPKQTEPVEGTISVTPTSLDFDYLSEKQKTFTVNTTGVTSVKLASGGTNGSKFSFTPLTGTNGTVFTVETKETNLSDQDYTGIVVVSDNDGVATAREITVNQKYEPIMQQFASTTFPATGGSIYFTVHTDYDVVFRSVPSYITISYDGTVYNEGQRISASEANNKTFVLTAEANTGNARTVQSTFNMGHYIGNELQNRVRYFNFTQEAAEPVKRLYILQEDFPVTSAATALSVTVTCENCEFNRFNYSQTGDFNIAAERSIGNTINLFFPANTGINEDSAIITFDLYDENNNLYNDTITIRRAGAEYIPSAEFEIPLHIEWNIPNGKTVFYEVRVSLMENGNEHSSASHYDTVTGDSTQDNTYEGTLQFNPTTEFDAVKITTTCVNQTEQESQIKVTVIYDQCGNDNPGVYNIINSGEAYELTCDSVNSGNIDETDPVFVTIDLS